MQPVPLRELLKVLTALVVTEIQRLTFLFSKAFSMPQMERQCAEITEADCGLEKKAKPLIPKITLSLFLSAFTPVRNFTQRIQGLRIPRKSMTRTISLNSDIPSL